MAYRDEPTALDWVRFIIGLIARGVMWACVIFIVGNAVVWTWNESAGLVAIAEAILFPLTFFIYPFVAEADATAWPLEDGTSFIPFLIVAVIAYPISTLVGGLRTV
jgi:hypothetical protein